MSHEFANGPPHGAPSRSTSSSGVGQSSKLSGSGGVVALRTLLMGLILAIAPIQLAATYRGRGMMLPEFFALFFAAALFTGALGVGVVHLWNWARSRRSRSKFEIVSTDYSNEMRVIDESIRYLDPDRAKKH